MCSLIKHHFIIIFGSSFTTAISLHIKLKIIFVPGKKFLNHPKEDLYNYQRSKGDITKQSLNGVWKTGLYLWRYVMDEIKSYMRGMAVCAMWEPAAGLQLCMRQYWIDLGNISHLFTKVIELMKCPTQGGG